jgi:hypothetical protein
MKSIREIFLPDPNEYFVKCDLSQIEDRMAKMYCNSERMRILANKPPWEYDAHTENSKAIFEKEKITKQERYLGKKCVHASIDKRTELLTKRGFVFVSSITQWDELAQWNIETSEISFSKPIEAFEYSYTGEMCRFRTKFFSQYLTADHRMVYETNANLKWCYAKDIPIGAKIPLNGYYSGATVINNDLVRLIVATQADATYMYKAGKLTIGWHLKKQNKIDRLLLLLKKIGVKDYYLHQGKHDDIYIRIRGKIANQIEYWLPDKKFNRNLFKLSYANLKVFINELCYWDGTKKPFFIYRSAEKENIDFAQAIAHLCGKRATISKNIGGETSFIPGSICYYLNISDIKHSTIKDKHIKYVANFPVYCFTVPDGYMIMRRNKCVSVTGNSWRKMGGVKMSESVSIDTDGKLFIPPADCNKLIKTYLKANPEIEGYYFPFVEHNVRNEGILYSSWGRRYDVRCLRIDDDLLRRCYSFYPQAEDADWINQYGLIPAHYYMMKHYNKPVALQLHDEVVVSVPFTGIYDYCVFIKNSLEQTRKIQGHDLTVPVELKISKTFYGGIEFKQLTDKVSFEKHLIEYFEGEGKNE